MHLWEGKSLSEQKIKIYDIKVIHIDDFLRSFKSGKKKDSKFPITQSIKNCDS